MTDGNMSLCIKYVKRLVWYAPDVMARATSTAFCRISATSLRQPASSQLGPFVDMAPPSALTGLAIPYYIVQRADKVGKHRVDVVETGKHRYYIGARVGVLLGQDRGQKRAEGLDRAPIVSHTFLHGPRTARNSVGHTSSAFACATPCALFSVLTARENRCRVWSSSCSRSSGVSSSRMRRRDARSGLRRNSSRQKPSGSSSCSSSWSSFPESAVGFLHDRGAGCLQTCDHMPRIRQPRNLADGTARDSRSGRRGVVGAPGQGGANLE